MSREDLLNEALHLIDKYNVTAYEIEKNTSLTAVGVQKIINGESKRPLENTLKDIISYIKTTYMLNERPTIINSNVANNVKGNVSQSVDAENERLRLENAMLKQRVGDLESRIEQYKETIDILKGVINK